MQKGKIVVWGGLTNSWEKKRNERQRRKGKIYPSECRVPEKARKDKKSFLSEQCKEVVENNRIGKTRDLFKKIRNTKGIFHAKMGTIKDRNCMDLTEAVPWTARRSKQSILKEINPEYSLEGLMLVETPILWPPDVKNWLIWKDPNVGKDWRQEEKGMTEDEIVKWHHWLNGHEFE